MQLSLLTVTPDKLIRIYAGELPNSGQISMPLTFHMESLGLAQVRDFTVHALNGSIMGTDVDISSLTSGAFKCWLEDGPRNASNIVALMIPATNTPIDFDHLIGV